MKLKTSEQQNQSTTKLTMPFGIRAFLDSTSGSSRAISNTFGPRLAVPEAQKTNHQIRFGRSLTESEVNQHRLIANLESRMIHDVEGLSPFEELNLAFVYNDLMPGDMIQPISLKKVKDFLEDVVKPANEPGYNKIMAYYNVEAEPLKKSKQEKLRSAAQSVLGNFRTIENAMQYSQGFYEAAVRMAPKLDAPEGMSVADRVKWLRLWVFIIRDQTYFWGDLDGCGKLKGKSHTAAFNQLYIYPETLMLVEKEYFSQMPDGAILYDMLLRMIKVFPQSVQDTVLHYGEIGSNVVDLSGKIEYVRNVVKKSMFEYPWLASSAFFCVKHTIANIVPERFAKAVEAHKNGGIETLPTFEYQYIDVYNDFKRRKTTAYQYATAMVHGQELRVGVTCKEELAMYVELYKWLLEHPDFKFGPECKTLKEYGLDRLLEEPLDFMGGASKWILDKGFAKDEQDINWDMVNAVLKPEENEEVFGMYDKGEVSSQTIFEQFRFSTEEQAIACFSKSSKIAVRELDKMSQALRRVKMFGESSALPGDLIYLEIFKFYAKNNPGMLGKGLVNMYGARFCQ